MSVSLPSQDNSKSQRSNEKCPPRQNKELSLQLENKGHLNLRINLGNSQIQCNLVIDETIINAPGSSTTQMSPPTPVPGTSSTRSPLRHFDKSMDTSNTGTVIYNAGPCNLVIDETIVDGSTRVSPRTPSTSMDTSNTGTGIYNAGPCNLVIDETIPNAPVSSTNQMSPPTPVPGRSSTRSPLRHFDNSTDSSTTGTVIYNSGPYAEKPTTSAADNFRANFDENRTCEICGRVLSSKTSLQRHKRTHTNDKIPLACHLCDAQFPTYYALDVHKRRHAGNMPKCDVCLKAFNTKYHLTRHMRSHNK
ncbi:zinc finger protein 816-like [Diabrotica virgifera virgifera]|uniref:C2H2-type domain-containing protein n=1 Tax=Diabrotica virgifera virgifera TaxID=50390 RepID=A0ABM5KTW4_DIAVI|nr:zinc finger protein 816-like [Diabrotica virgifera virgifera]